MVKQSHFVMGMKWWELVRERMEVREISNHLNTYQKLIEKNCKSVGNFDMFEYMDGVN